MDDHGRSEGEGVEQRAVPAHVHHTGERHLRQEVVGVVGRRQRVRLEHLGHHRFVRRPQHPGGEVDAALRQGEHGAATGVIADRRVGRLLHQPCEQCAPPGRAARLGQLRPGHEQHVARRQHLVERRWEHDRYWVGAIARRRASGRFRGRLGRARELVAGVPFEYLIARSADEVGDDLGDHGRRWRWHTVELGNRRSGPPIRELMESDRARSRSQTSPQRGARHRGEPHGLLRLLQQCSRLAQERVRRPDARPHVDDRRRDLAHRRDGVVHRVRLDRCGQVDPWGGRESGEGEPHDASEVVAVGGEPGGVPLGSEQPPGGCHAHRVVAAFDHVERRRRGVVVAESRGGEHAVVDAGVEQRGSGVGRTTERVSGVLPRDVEQHLHDLADPLAFVAPAPPAWPRRR